MGYTFGFIGTGNMGSALAEAASKAVEPNKIILSNRTAAKAEKLAEKIGCDSGDNLKAANESKYIFLGVKPQMMSEMLEGIKNTLSARKDRFILVSMAAGLSIDSIKNMAGNYPVIRIMPNTPVSIGRGMTLCASSDDVTAEEQKEFLSLMRFSGRLDFIEERLIDAASALSGCGPAYVYLFIEALADGAVECGLPRAKAMEYACQTLIGSAALVLESGKHPGELKDAVCSPGGTTIAGVHALERNGFRNAAMDCVKAAYDKTKSIGK